MNKIYQKVVEIPPRYAVGKTTLYKAIREGKLPARKLGASTLIRTQDLEGFLDSLPRLKPTGGKNGRA